MKIQIKRYFGLILIFYSLFINTTPVQAQPVYVPTAYDVIAAVNALRVSKGLAPWATSAGLMGTAQAQSDYQASIGTWTHTGADGSSSHDRILGAGYYGYENVAIMNNSQNLNYLIYTLWADSIHWNLMVSTQYTYCGVGVTSKAGMNYITLDAGYITGKPGVSNTSPNATIISGGTPGTPGAATGLTATPNIIAAVVVSTPQGDGKVIHVVQAGQALSSIAVAYGVKIADIRALNSIAVDNNKLYVGQKLLIRLGNTATPTETITDTPLPPTRTLMPSSTKGTPLATNTRLATQTQTPLPLLPKMPSLGSNQRQSIGIILVVVCGLGLASVLVSRYLKKS